MLTFLPIPLLNAACQPYKNSGRFAWHFAQGKLSRDPVFSYIVINNMFGSEKRVLDIGCGQGLLAALLFAPQSQHWPAAYPKPIQPLHYTGIELMPNDVARAKQALSQHPLSQGKCEFINADMRNAQFPSSDIVVILDVLHYVDYVAQEDVLRRVHAALTSGGMLLLRVGDAAAGLPFRISNWVDAVVTTIRGHRLNKLYCRPLLQWQHILEEIGFDVQTVPMHQGTPFANILLIATKPNMQKL